jgi:hypothetical protein
MDVSPSGALTGGAKATHPPHLVKPFLVQPGFSIMITLPPHESECVRMSVDGSEFSMQASARKPLSEPQSTTQ